MSSINKIYKVLAVIEQDLVEYTGHSRSSHYIAKNYESLKMDKIRLTNKLNELISLYENAGETVKCADFQFLKETHRIDKIIWAIGKMIEKCSEDIDRLYRMYPK